MESNSNTVKNRGILDSLKTGELIQLNDGLFPQVQDAVDLNIKQAVELNYATGSDGIRKQLCEYLPNDIHSLHRSGGSALICQPVNIKRNDSIGAAAVKLPGVTVGENAKVVAGAVASKDIPANTVVGDLTARHIKLFNSKSV